MTAVVEQAIVGGRRCFSVILDGRLIIQTTNRDLADKVRSLELTSGADIPKSILECKDQ